MEISFSGISCTLFYSHEPFDKYSKHVVSLQNGKENQPRTIRSTKCISTWGACKD